MNDLYSIINSGETQTGHDVAQVQDAFAKLFKLSLEKAAVFIGARRVIKKGLDLNRANAYKQKLEAIGLVVELQREEPVVSAPSLTLEPTEEEVQAADTDDSSTPKTTITCPKCNLEQPKTEQCTGCGVYMHKVRHIMEEATRDVEVTGDDDYDDYDDDIEDEDEEDESFNYKPVAAAAAAAVVGAFLWKFITVITGYELGLIAWLIGGMVGFAAAMFGSRAPVIGVACGVFALLAIFAGKYMAIEAIQSDWMEEFMTLSEDGGLQYEYDNLIAASIVYTATVTDDESQLQFIVDYGYSDEEDVASVTEEEVTYFKESILPDLNDMANNKPSYEQWEKQWIDSLEEELGGISTMDLVKEDLGWMDFLFLFFGVSTAFRLGSGRR